MQHPRNLSQLHLLLLPHPPLCLPRGLILSPPTEGQVTPLLLWVRAACVYQIPYKCIKGKNLLMDDSCAHT